MRLPFASPFAQSLAHLDELARERHASSLAPARARRSAAAPGASSRRNVSRTIVVARVRDHSSAATTYAMIGSCDSARPVREPAGNPGVEERRLELVADLVLPVEQGDLAPGVPFSARSRRMSSTSQARSAFVGVEVERAHAEWRRPLGLGIFGSSKIGGLCSISRRARSRMSRGQRRFSRRSIGLVTAKSLTKLVNTRGSAPAHE